MNESLDPARCAPTEKSDCIMEWLGVVDELDTTGTDEADASLTVPLGYGESSAHGLLKKQHCDNCV